MVANLKIKDVHRLEFLIAVENKGVCAFGSDFFLGLLLFHHSGLRQADLTCYRSKFRLEKFKSNTTSCVVKT
jgi:hypothetical protein